MPTAVICTHDQTFEVRQVQSSNILYIVQPSPIPASNESEPSSVSGVTAIGQCKALLELVPVQTQPVQFLRNAIPIYNEKKYQPNIHQWAPEIKSKQVLLTNAPFSTAEFEAAWTELCAFEIEDEAWRPSALQLHEIWASFMTETRIQGIDVTNTFQYIGRILTVVEDCWDEAMPHAILRRLSSDHENISEGCELSVLELDFSRSFIVRRSHRSIQMCSMGWACVSRSIMSWESTRSIEFSAIMERPPARTLARRCQARYPTGI